MMRFRLPILTTLLTVTALTTPTLPAQNVGLSFQIPNQVRLRTGYLGVGIVDVDADRLSRLKLTEERGVEVTVVEEGSPADTAGIKAGDVLFTYNGETILGSQQFVRLVRETPASRKVRVSLWRNGKEQSLMVTTAAPHLHLSSQEPGESVFNFTTPDLRGFVVPEIPTVIMAWNSLGIECEPIDSQLAQYFGVKQGVLVRSVGKGTVGETAGFRAGDVLTSVGNHPVRTPDDFRRNVRTGVKQVAVSVMRDRKELTLNVIPVQDHEE